MTSAVGRSADLLALDEALAALERLHPQAAELVSLKYFGGLTSQELAQTLQVSEATIARRWRVARAWLYAFLTAQERDDP